MNSLLAAYGSSNSSSSSDAEDHGAYEVLPSRHEASEILQPSPNSEMQSWKLENVHTAAEDFRGGSETRSPLGSGSSSLPYNSSDGEMKRRRLGNEVPLSLERKFHGEAIQDGHPLSSTISLPNGRYVSKRERAAAADAASSAGSASSSHSPLVLPSPGVKEILDAELPPRILKTLQNIVPEAQNYNRLPRRIVSELNGHKKAVNSISWSPKHASLLASAGMDHMAFVWNVWNETGHQMVRKLDSHAGAVKNIQWTADGRFVLTCGFDKSSRLTDVEKGSVVNVFPDDQYLNVAKFHPIEDSTFLSGGSSGVLKLWDIRSGKPERHYSKNLGQIMDLDFSIKGNQFVSTSDMAKRHASDKAIVVWDYNKQVALSNQVYVEAYTCPCVRYHPFECAFIAQSNANYIAIFAANAPFRMNKYKRYEGHQVSAYPIQCNFSPCGGLVVTGSSDGCIHIYSYRTSKQLLKLSGHNDACTDVSYHPVLPSVIASCGWDGRIHIYE